MVLLWAAGAWRLEGPHGAPATALPWGVPKVCAQLVDKQGGPALA